MTQHPMNQERGTRLFLAVQDYRRNKNFRAVSVVVEQEDVTDFLNDLFHYIDTLGFDGTEIVTDALRSYTEELEYPLC